MFKIFKRQKPIQTPTPSFENNWKQEMFEKNVCTGLQPLTLVKKYIYMRTEEVTNLL